MENQVDTSQPAADQIPAGLAEMMAISLNGGFAPQATETVVDAAAGTTTTTTTPDPTTPFTFTPFTEKFGYQSPEDAFKEIEELRALKANPTTAEIKFENDYSKNLFNAIKEGKDQDVYNYLAEKQKIEKYTSAEVTEEIAPEIVKLAMQLKFKDLTPAEIDFKYKKQFGIPSKPVQGDVELDEDYNARVSAWEEVAQDKKMELLIEAKMSKPEIEAQKSKLVLPTIDSAIDPDYAQYQKDMEAQGKSSEETQQFYQSVVPKQLETKINFKDEANKIDFDFQFEPDATSLSEVAQLIADGDSLFKKFHNQDGTPNRTEFLKAIYFGINREKVIAEAMKQTVYATIKASLPDNSNGGVIRQMPQQQEMTELQRMMEYSVKV